MLRPADRDCGWLAFGRRVATGLAIGLLLLVGSAAAQGKAADGKASDKDKKEPESKNYSIPWVITIAGILMIVVPVCAATRRKWDLPFELEDEQNPKKAEKPEKK